jgi:signal transduction histidine kinase
MKKFVLSHLYLLFFISSYTFFWQNPTKQIDSLKQTLLSKKDSVLITTLDEIAWQYKAINVDSALKYSKESIKYSKIFKNDKITALVYNTLATVYEAKSELDSALYFHNKSLVLRIKENDSIGIADSYNNFGIIYDERGEYLKSLNSYFKALNIYEKVDAPFDRLCLVYVNIGIVYKKQKEYKKSLNFYKKAIGTYKKNNHRVGEIITTSNISSIYLELEDFETAIKYSEVAAEGLKEIGYSRYIAYMKHNMAIAKTGLKNYADAVNLYLEIIDEFEKTDNKFELADAKINLAKNYNQTNKLNKARKQLLNVLKIIRKNEFKEKELQALSLLSKISFKQCRYKDAYNYLKIYDTKKDSVFEKDKIKSILELETKYQTEKKEKELLKTRTEKAETELALSNTKNWIYILLVILTFSGGIFFTTNQRNKRKTQEQITKQRELGLQAIINAQEEERSKIARELHDGVVQQIGSVILKSRHLFTKQNLIGNKESQEVLESLENSNQDLRNISHQMMPRALKELGIIPALNDLLEGSLTLSNIKYHIEQFNINERLPEKIEITIYRVTQELITNILKHSKATEVSVQLINSNNSIILIVEDNGVGFSKTKTNKGIGLLNISSRLDMVKGSVNFEPSPKSGTLVTVKIPL